MARGRQGLRDQGLEAWLEFHLKYKGKYEKDFRHRNTKGFAFFSGPSGLQCEGQNGGGTGMAGSWLGCSSAVRGDGPSGPRQWWGSQKELDGFGPLIVFSDLLLSAKSSGSRRWLLAHFFLSLQKC